MDRPDGSSAVAATSARCSYREGTIKSWEICATFLSISPSDATAGSTPIRMLT
jgi:hypothetical protein